MSDREQHEEPSLDQLSQAFAKAMGRNKSADAEASTTEPVAEAPDQTNTPKVDPDDGCPISPKSIFEAILFVGHPENEPIAGRAIAKLLRGVEEDELPEIAGELNQDFLSQQMPYEVVVASTTFENESDDATDDSDDETGNETDDSVKQDATTEQIVGYRIQLRAEFDHLRENFYGQVREAQLSQLAIDVLAVVAYNQPIARPEIDRLLDTPLDTGRVINQLVRRGLLDRQTNNDAGKSRGREFVTTDRFLELFQLQDLQDLPQSDCPE